MAYEFGRDEAVADAVRRIAGEQLDVARSCLASIGDDGTEVADAIHEARKCCKRVRGLVRLVRPALGDDYRRGNTTARDAARHLSDVRDAHALVGTFDELVAARSDQVPSGGLGPLRTALVDDASRATQRLEEDPAPVAAARGLLEDLRGGVDDWTFDGDLDEAIAAGAARTASRARDRFREVVADDGRPGDELLHQWRKRVKYGWYHATLLEPASPTLIGVHADLLHDLSSSLGDDHDLAVLTAVLQADPSRFGGPSVVEGAMVLVDGSRADLQRRAVAAGARAHAEDPGAWGARLVALVQAWRRHGEERVVGGLDDLHDPADDLGDRTTGQLRDLARAVELAGRSTMGRAELLAALRVAPSTS